MNFPDRCSPSATAIDLIDRPPPARPALSLRGPFPRRRAVAWLAGASFMAAAAASPVLDRAPAVTLRQLVEAAQRHKADELATAAAKLAGRAPAQGSRPGAGQAAAREDAEAPRLWTLQGVGPRWRAEVLHRGRVHRIDAPIDAAVRIGAWRVVELAPEGLILEHSSGAARGARRLVLAPPCRGTLAAAYGFETPSGRRESPAQALSLTAEEQDALRQAAGLPPVDGAAPVPEAWP
jgi:hypothetical protein